MTKAVSSVARVSVLLCSLALALGAIVAAPQALAQQMLANIWEVPLGTHADDLPPEFMIRACGTNGGPPSIVLFAFNEFARCAVDRDTGLYEVWFSFDDEAEYYLRATRAREETIEANRANKLFGQLVIYSFLFDSEGRVQGHRIISDPRETPEFRFEADITIPIKMMAYGGLGWTCRDLPRLDGEEPFGGRYEKELCEKTADGKFITLETHFYRKAGQMAGRPGAPRDGEFEIGIRAQVINADLVN